MSFRKFKKTISAASAANTAAYLAGWSSLLPRWGTPLSEIEGAVVRGSRFLWGGRAYRAAWTEGGIRERRYQLMPLWLDSEATARKPCPLCRKIERVNRDTSLAMLGGDYGMVVPNRYPGTAGHSLYIPFTHTNLSASSTDWTDQDLSPELLLELLKYCQRFGLQASRNHPRDGMSVPAHDHIHLFPESAGLYPVCDLADSSGLNSGLLPGTITPFKTERIYSSNNEELVFLLLERLKDHRSKNLVSTFAYSRFSFYITTRKSGDMPRLIVGGGISGHRMNPFDQTAMKQIQAWIPSTL